MSKESRITEQTQQFRSLAELAWTKNTIYPRSKQQFHVFTSRGQCGVANFGLGVWLVWRGLVRPSQILYAEGQVHDTNGELIDDKHAWLLRRKAFSGLLRHVDLALDQYSGVGQDVATSVVKKQRKTSKPLAYAVDVENDERPCRTTRVTYSPSTITPLETYDTAEFGGRLETFLGSCYNSTRFMGQQAISGALEELWLPDNSMQPLARRLEVVAMKPCDAQLFSSI